MNTQLELTVQHLGHYIVVVTELRVYTLLCENNYYIVSQLYLVVFAIILTYSLHEALTH